MNGRFIPLSSLSEADRAAWRDLAARAAEPNPLFEDLAIEPAATHQENGDGISLLVAETGGRFDACIPIHEEDRWRRSLPYPAFTSHVRRMLYLGTPLVDERSGLEAVTALLSALAEQRRRGHAQFYGLEWSIEGRASGLFGEAANELGLPVKVFESFERGSLVRTDAAAPIFRNDRTLQKKRRRIERELGGELGFTDRGDDPAAIDAYFALEASGYKGATGLASGSVPDDLLSSREMYARFLRVGRLHLPTLEIDGQPLAMQVWLRGGPGIVMIKTSYDERYASHSPGLLLHHEARQYFFEQTDAEWFDTGTFADNELLLHLYPQRRRIVTLAIGLGGRLDALRLKKADLVRGARKRLSAVGAVSANTS